MRKSRYVVFCCCWALIQAEALQKDSEESACTKVAPVQLSQNKLCCCSGHLEKTNFSGLLVSLTALTPLLNALSSHLCGKETEHNKRRITFEWVSFEGVFRVEGVSLMLLRLAVENRCLRFKWILLL